MKNDENKRQSTCAKNFEMNPGVGVAKIHNQQVQSSQKEEKTVPVHIEQLPSLSWNSPLPIVLQNLLQEVLDDVFLEVFFTDEQGCCHHQIEDTGFELEEDGMFEEQRHTTK